METNPDIINLSCSDISISLKSSTEDFNVDYYSIDLEDNLIENDLPQNNSDNINININNNNNNIIVKNNNNRCILKYIIALAIASPAIILLILLFLNIFTDIKLIVKS